MVMTYPRSSRRRRFGTSGTDAERLEAMNRQVRELYAFLENAREYAAVEDARTEPLPPGEHVDQVLQSMAPVMRGELPAIFDVETEEQIRGVLALADSFHIKVVLRGAADAWKLASEIAQHHVPVIVGPLTSAPAQDEPYDAVYGNPGALARAGVTIAFQSDNAADVRNLPYQAALATAYGLAPDAAIRALTINPATIWGVADRYGSLETGKVANVIVTTGDPLDVRSTVKYLFIRGALVPFTDKHTELYEQFRARPRPKPTGKDG
jgi:imidazolonepropionase-like amidohydrolase